MKETIKIALEPGVLAQIDKLAEEIPELGSRDRVFKALTLVGIEHFEKNPKELEELVRKELAGDKAKRTQARAKRKTPRPKRG